MRTGIALFVFIALAALVFPLRASAVQGPALDFTKIFEDNELIMLLLDPASGEILHANRAAADFYGYSEAQLNSMNTVQLDDIDPEKTLREIRSAAARTQNHFFTMHRTADGRLIPVEVYSYPTEQDGSPVLFSIVYDLTEKKRLEADRHTALTVFGLTGAGALASLLVLSAVLHQRTKSLSLANKSLESFSEQWETFINADSSSIYLKDENLKYALANTAMEEFLKRPRGEIIGRDAFELLEHDFAQMLVNADREVLERHKTVTSVISRGGRFYQMIKFPVRMLNGRYGVGGHISDITGERERSIRQERTLKHHQLLLEIMSRGFSSRQEQLDYALHKLLDLTASQYGYIYFYDEKKEEFTLNSWTNGVMQDCAIHGSAPKRYRLSETGIWGEVVRQRGPVIVNRFNDPNPLKKGYPAGHVQLNNFMSIPVFIDDEIVAVVGFANKPADYEEYDVHEITLLMIGVWNAVQRRESVETLAFEREKYFQTLLSIGDGVMVVDRDGRVEMLNGVASRLTGWSQQEAVGQNYKNVFILAHEQEGATIDDPIQKVFLSGNVQQLGNHAVLLSRTGDRYFLEDSAAPIMDDKSDLAGVVLVFRDVTERKEQRRKIEYMSFHDSLTGLYNRRFFEEELRRIDTARNLPISIIMGDVNSLKLTNDIFGHSSGDLLLEKVAEVMRGVCRADDIIARWGGDEFVLLLPKTGPAEAKRILQRIKSEVSAQQIRALSGSIAMGYDTKSSADEDITQILNSAEANMYYTKTLERGDVQSRALDSIINDLTKHSTREKRHAQRVSELCESFGRALLLTKGDLQRLIEAGRLHDIGKIVLDPELLGRQPCLNEAERRELERHPVIGCRILNSFGDTLELAEVVLAHHEYWDGSGYPKGLKGKEIPLLARIVSLAQGYDRMLHPPEGGEVKSQTEALAALRELAGKRFDPQLTDAFIAMLEKAGG